LDAKLLTSFDPSRVQTELETTLAEIMSPGVYVLSLQPETVRQTIIGSVNGIQDVKISKFTRTVGSVQNVEIINYEANEESKLDTAFSVITVL